MLVKLKLDCVLGKSGHLLNLPMSRGGDLIRTGVAIEFTPEREMERKVIVPEIKEQAKKRGRPRKTPCDTD